LQVIFKKRFEQSLKSIVRYIARDSIKNAMNFKEQLESMIDNISNMPYKHRKSFYYNDDNTRDMIFKGYTLPYLIDTKNNCIVLLDIFKWVNK
jgi:plasmid stabilization system protein ParE